jgi:hypothetical protein
MLLKTLQSYDAIVSRFNIRMEKIRDSYSSRNEGTNKSGIKWVRHVECMDEIIKNQETTCKT